MDKYQAWRATTSDTGKYIENFKLAKPDGNK